MKAIYQYSFRRPWNLLKSALNWVVLMFVYTVESWTWQLGPRISLPFVSNPSKPYTALESVLTDLNKPHAWFIKVVLNGSIQLTFAYKLFVGLAFQSCLHYNNHAFSKNGDDTIQAIKDPARRFGQRESFSTHDILQVNELYKCHVTNLHEKMRDISYN